MHDAKVAESRWQVAPGDACAVAVQHGIDEQAVVLGCGSRLTCLAGQQILDALPLRTLDRVSTLRSTSHSASRASTPR
ncbi:hypothetical protein DFR34_10439 [Rivihabitans pingtungensis]|uniref:Uncharacterized protein n=1 Tax=Rivihabitans pingtungensis TaxID=1054498 RepID=A0A318KTV5_9NEIS|nr:hypothetical protein DFR34_10439 [Rivihabitans pingtungensis]